MRMQWAGGGLLRILRREFAGYGAGRFQQDLIAGVTVAAVALPLSLAFGVASGVTAAAGVVTAILSGLIMGALGGLGFQISGPTGTMTAVLIVLASRYGFDGMFTATLLAGVILLLMGIFNLGGIVNFIPSAVIAGFTSGIASIIFIGQLDNILGIQTPHTENALMKIVQYFEVDFTINPAAVGLTLLVMAIMIFWPQRLGRYMPGSLLGLIVATVVMLALGLEVSTIGTIPQTIFLDDRLHFTGIRWELLGDLLVPALSIAALASIESLLCGAVAARMTGNKLIPNHELVVQGVANMITPFFGGLPPVNALARTSVAVRSGGTTRIVSIVHSLVLLAIVLALGPMIAKVPLAALGGVLAVTTWRMNDWPEIRKIFRQHFKSAMGTYLVTLGATVALDLTQAIIIGVGLAALIFMVQISRARVAVARVSPERMRQQGYEMHGDCDHITVVYTVGPLFFGTLPSFTQALEDLGDTQDLILSLRTVPLIDTSGAGMLLDLIDSFEQDGRRLYLCGLNEQVRSYLQRSGVIARLGEDRVFWDAQEAIIAADRYRAGEPPVKPRKLFDDRT